MMNKHLALTLATCLVAATPSISETTPKAGHHDARVRYITWHDGQVYRINTRLKRATLIELDKGEVIATVSPGDSHSFQIEQIASRNAFAIKPLVRGAQTNAVVETNRRFYLLELYETAADVPYYSVRFKAPNSSRSSRAMVAPASQPMSYKVAQGTDGATITPIRIWDDGRKTYFSFKADAPIPSVFKTDAKGREYTVNVSGNGTILTVPTRSERWVLRHGDEFICIEGVK